MNATGIDQRSNYTIEDYYVSAAVSSSFALLSIVTSSIILILVWRTKPRLHTVNHLLICNTCVASILYCVVTMNNYLFLLFIRWETSDMSCRWRGYFIYAGIAALTYSYFIQAVSRLCFSVLPANYRWLKTFKTHFILICLQWFLVFLIVLPNILTKDIRFSPTNLCWVPSECLLHTAYTYFAYYVIPIGSIIVIYIYIFWQIRKKQRNGSTLQRSLSQHKRDLQVLRNILILIGIYLGGGLPTTVADFTSSKLSYLISLITQVFAVLLANLCIILLDRELRQVVRGMLRRTTSIMPLDNIRPTGRNQQNRPNIN